jgi:hypothetical protein
MLVTVFLLESSVPFAFHDFTGMHANDRNIKKGVKPEENPADVFRELFIFSYGPNILNSSMNFASLHVVHL